MGNLNQCCSTSSPCEDINGVTPMSPAALARMRRNSLEHTNASAIELDAEMKQIQQEQTVLGNGGVNGGGGKGSKKKSKKQGKKTAGANGIATNDDDDPTAAHRTSGSISSVTRAPLTTQHTASLLPALHADRDRERDHSAANSARPSPRTDAAAASGAGAASKTVSTATSFATSVSGGDADSGAAVAAAIADAKLKATAAKKPRKSILTAPDASGESQPVTSGNAPATAAASTSAAAAATTKPKAPKAMKSTKAPVLSLEDEEDERTARSLRNFEAEHVLAEQAALMCTFHGMDGSTSPSPTPGGFLNHSRSLTAQQAVYFFPSPSPLSNVSACHTPRDRSMTPAAYTPRGQAHSSGATTPTRLTVSTAYTNAEFLAHPAEAAMHTPGGARTAMALLLTGNQSARTSPRSSAQNSPRHYGMTGAGAGAVSRGFKQLSLGGGGSLNGGGSVGGGRSLLASKTVPNSPQHSRSPSPSRGGGGNTNHASVFSTTLTVPGNIVSPSGPSHPLPSPVGVSSGSGVYKLPSRAFPPVYSGSATRGSSTSTSHKQHHSTTAAVRGGQQIPGTKSTQYSHSVQTSPRHSRNKSHGAVVSMSLAPSVEASPDHSHYSSAATARSMLGDDLLLRSSSARAATNSSSASSSAATTPANGPTSTKSSTYARFQARLKAQAGTAQQGTAKSMEQAWVAEE